MSEGIWYIKDTLKEYKEYKEYKETVVSLSTIAGMEYIRNNLSYDQQIELVKEFCKDCRKKSDRKALIQTLTKSGLWDVIVNSKDPVELDCDADLITIIPNFPDDESNPEINITFKPVDSDTHSRISVIKFIVSDECDVYLPDNVIPVYDPRHPHSNEEKFPERKKFYFTYTFAEFYWYPKLGQWLENCLINKW